MLTFSEQFMANRGEAIDVDGSAVVPMFRVAVRGGDRLRFIWRRSIPAPVQGIRMSLKKGAIEVAGRELEHPVCWRDTAPDEFDAVCRTKKVGDIGVWNCWRIHQDVTQAWVGNAGMRITVTGASSWRIACNSRSEITFEDLVFDLVLEPVDLSVARRSSREP